jgi:pyridoxal phosphate enzyme (YggS family)
VDVSVIRERADNVREIVAGHGRDRGSVKIVAVTKGFDSHAVDAAIAAGLTDLGENYSGELIEKAGALSRSAEWLPGELSWHFLGAIQRRKVRDLARFVGVWHSVCRLSEAQSISACSPGSKVLIQVDTTGIAGRNGCGIDEAAGLVRSASELDLDVAGLMTVAAPGSAESARSGFRQVAALGRELGLRELSMGMTGDYEVAIEEGATMLRLGRYLFGDRPPRS